MEEHHTEPTTQAQVLKTKRIKRRRHVVQFSEMSSMLCYDVETSQQQDLHYASSDYARFKRDALHEAHKIRSTIESSNQDYDSAIADANNKNKSPLMRYTDSWKRLPHSLQEHGIDLDRVIGIEHLAIGKKMLHVSIALRDNYTRIVLERQSQSHSQCSQDPEVLTYAAKPFSKVSSFIAYSRAKHAAL